MLYGAREDQRAAARRHLLSLKLEYHEIRVDWTSTEREFHRQSERWSGVVPPGPPFIDHDVQRVCRILFWVAVVAYAAEFAGAFYAGPSWMDNVGLGALTVGLIAMAIALAYLILIKLGWVLMIRDLSNPVPEVRRLQLAVKILLGINLALFCGFTVTRFFPLAETLMLPQLTLLCVFLPPLATGALTLEKWLGHRNKLAKDYEALQIEARQYVLLIDQMEAVLEPEELESILRTTQRVEAQEGEDK